MLYYIVSAENETGLNLTAGLLTQLKAARCREPAKESFFMGICRLREVGLVTRQGVSAPTAGGFLLPGKHGTP